MDLIGWILAYLVVSTVATIFWRQTLALAMLALRASPVVLVGCVAWTGAGDISRAEYQSFDWSEKRTMEVCIAGEDRPELTQALSDEAALYGISTNVRPLDDRFWSDMQEWRKTMYDKRHASDDASDTVVGMLAMYPTGCHLVVYYHVPTGIRVSCAVLCEGAVTRRRIGDVIDAAIWVNLPTANVVRHEFYHIFGDECGHDSNNCAARIHALKRTLPAGLAAR